jgi:hypothetical protein
LYRNRRNEKHSEIIEDKDIDSLIRADLVTCTRYYRNITNDLNRGSEHEHGFLWIEDAPIYGKHSDSEIATFFGRYITCDVDHLHPNLAKLHWHCHTRRCKK